MITTDTRPRRQALVDRLTADGALRSPQWTAAFATVPRECFVDRFTVPTAQGLVTYDLSKPDQRATALDAVYSPTSLLTQFDTGGTATSSSTDPPLMAIMLEQLDVRPGHMVLEIGTGTGYNAALLACALGGDRVFSIDIDPALTGRARSALATAGYAPTVATGDGAAGLPEHGPYDRIIATCGMDRVPATWLHQIAPGGIILVNLGFALARLQITATGAASGPFTDTAAFMLRRDHIDARETTAADVLGVTNEAGFEQTSTAAALEDPTVASLRSLVFPHLRMVSLPTTGERRLYDGGTGAWCRVHTPANSSSVTTTAATDAGHDLWRGLAQLAAMWTAHGKPDLSRFGVTVHPSGTHHLWLDNPSTPITPLP